METIPNRADRSVEAHVLPAHATMLIHNREVSDGWITHEPPFFTDLHRTALSLEDELFLRREVIIHKRTAQL